MDQVYYLLVGFVVVSTTDVIYEVIDVVVRVVSSVMSSKGNMINEGKTTIVHYLIKSYLS
jgi:hypothetical protein